MVQIPELLGVFFREEVVVAQTEYRDQHIVRGCDQPQIGVIVLETDVSGDPSFDSQADDLTDVLLGDVS